MASTGGRTRQRGAGAGKGNARPATRARRGAAAATPTAGKKANASRQAARPVRRKAVRRPTERSPRDKGRSQATAGTSRAWAVYEQPERMDDFGLERDFILKFLPLFRLLYRHYWRVTTEGIENVPDSGGAFLVGNHSGVIPWDALMVSTAVWEEHRRPRHVRALFHDMLQNMPFLSPIASRAGFVLAKPENAQRLLAQGDLCLVFPEGLKGIGKSFGKRYHLARFGRGGFVRTALQTGAPMVPVAIVGAEEIYPQIANLRTLARLLKVPFFPVTPTFPLLGLLGLIPLPTKWTIRFGAPIRTDIYPRKDASDFVLINQLATEVRARIQAMLDELVAARRGLFR